MSYAEAGRALGVHPNSLRYAAATGTVLIRWEGARRPVVWTVPKPEITPAEARLDLARRYLHVFGPATAAGFAVWAGIRPAGANSAFEALADTLIPVGTPVGDGWILAADESDLRSTEQPVAPARLLPSGDAYFLLQGAERELLVPDAARRGQLWTPRVWPGALLVGGEVVGTWRRAQEKVTIQTWRRLSRGEQDAVVAEAAILPLPDVHGKVIVRWDD
jgi:hypothetical protein